MSQSDAAKLRITLLDLDPAPWRRIEARLTLTLKGLHDAIQAAFCWYDYHLWEFSAGGKRYGPAAQMGWGVDPVLLARNKRLGALIEKGVTRFDYTYDFGDDWRHAIEILDLHAVADDQRLPRFVDGKHRAPPEDIGGPPGYEHFLEILHDPDHPEWEDYEHLIDDPIHGPFDPDDIQLETINALMSRVARRKRARPKA